MSDNKTPVVFTGKASEYFGIWIVNLLLSIVTLGIYSAWAKVRRNKYFYNNTLVDGVGFDYHANPIAILKGRIIAFVLFVVYSTTYSLSPVIGILMALALFIALPWIIVRGMMFNARNSSYRGLRFDFNGKYGEAVKVFIGYTLLIIVTLGLAIPFVEQRTQKFIITGHKFGVSNFKMEALVRDFYKIYLILFIIPLLGIIAAVAIPAYQVYKVKAGYVSVYQPQSFKQTSTTFNNDNGGFIKVTDVTTAETIDDVTADAAASDAFNAANSIVAEEDFVQSLSPEERAEYERLISAADANNPEYDTAAPDTPIKEAFSGIAAKWGLAAAALIGLVGILLYLAIIFSFIAYMKSRIQNLVFNNTSLEHIGFFSNQRMRDLILLYITNALILLFTLGLATPWVQIRMAKYRANHLALTGETDWDKFVGEKKDASRALGEEIAEMFDVDISFG